MTHCGAVKYPLFFVFFSMMAFAGEQRACDVPGVKLSEVMRAAAEKFPSVAALRSSIQATGKERAATVLDNLSVTGYASKNYLRSTTRNGIAVVENADETIFAGLNAQLLLSFTTIFQERALHINQESQRAALLGLQMELATEAARAYLIYTTANFRLLYLNIFLNKYKETLAKFEGKNAKPLKPSNLLTLRTDRTILTADIANVETEKQVQAAALRKFLGPEVLAAVEKSMAFKAKLMIERDEPINLEAVEQIFPFPDNIDDAINDIPNNPAMRQAYLAVRAARNKFYLTMSRYAPVASIGVTKSFASNHYTLPLGESEFITRGDTLTFTVSFGIGGGALLHLSGDSLLEEAARHSEQGVQLNFDTIVRQDYANGRHLEKALPGLAKTLVANVKLFTEVQVGTDDEALVLHQNLASLSGVMNLVSIDTIQLLLARISVERARGTLINSLDDLKAVEVRYTDKLP